MIVARPSAARGKAGEALRRLCALLRIEPLVTESPRGLSDLKYSELIRNASQCDVALVVAPADFAVSFLDAQTLGSASEVLLIDAPGDPRPARLPEAWTRVPPAEALHYLITMMNGERGGARESKADSLPLPSPPEASPAASDEGVHPLAVAEEIRRGLQLDDVVVLDGGEFCQWVRLGLRDISQPVLWNGKLGAIGGGIPMGIGAALAGRPGRVYVVMGDGSSGYHLSEYETAARYGIPIIGIIGNDARWAAEWHMQVARYGVDRAFDTELLAARYDIAAKGFCALGSFAADRAALAGALADAVAGDDPVCINVRIQSVRSPAEVKH